MIDFVIGYKEVVNTVFVKFYSGIIRTYEATELTKAWFNMSNDTFFEIYGFSYVPSIGMQQWYRKKYYGE